MLYLQKLDRLVWGVPMAALILGAGFYLSWKTGFVQIRLFPQALKQVLHPTGKTEPGAVPPMRALCTALAATVGTGNIAGVAGAIALGGPGAVFWMWVSGFAGMAIKYAEAVLALRYRVRDESGSLVGGPMYMIRQGMPDRWHWMAGLYSFLGVLAAFGVGNATQINAVITGAASICDWWNCPLTGRGSLLLAAALAVLTGVMLLGGADRIGKTAERLVPMASAVYLLLGIGVLVIRAEFLPEALASIFRGAFSPRAVTGGAIGSGMAALRMGLSRGVFTNEAGMGTASIAHASAQVRHPAEQGMMGLVEVFVDTIVICTMTALAILCSGAPIPYGLDPGAALTSRAFSEVYGGWVTVLLTAAICCFAFATVLGWGLYGMRCAQYLFGSGSWRYMAVLQVGTVFLGGLLKTELVWTAAELVNGLMAIPNLIALIYLCPELVRLTREKTAGCNLAASGGRDDQGFDSVSTKSVPSKVREKTLRFP